MPPNCTIYNRFTKKKLRLTHPHTSVNVCRHCGPGNWKGVRKKFTQEFSPSSSYFGCKRPRSLTVHRTVSSRINSLFSRFSSQLYAISVYSKRPFPAPNDSFSRLDGVSMEYTDRVLPNPPSLCQGSRFRQFSRLWNRTFKRRLHGQYANARLKTSKPSKNPY